MDRHEWGRLHFWIAVVLLVLHLFLHWRWGVCMVKGLRPERSGIRAALAMAGVMALVALAVAPFFGRVERTGAPRA